MKILNLVLFSLALACPQIYAGGGFDYQNFAKAPVSHSCKQSYNSCSKSCYIFGYGGVSLSDDVWLQSRVNIDYHLDYTLGAGIGFSTPTGFRFELEGIHQEHDNVEHVQVAGLGDFTDGSESSVALTAGLINLLKEFPLGKFTGTLGGGGGYGEADFHLDNPGTGFGALSSSDEVFVYQLIAGLDIPLSECLDFMFQYKWLSFHPSKTFGSSEKFETQNLVFGLRYSF